MLRAINVIIALALSQGWQWGKLAEAYGYFSSESVFLLTASMGLLFLAHQFTGGIKEPAPRDDVRARAAVLDDFLESFVSNYYKILLAQFGDKATMPAVRANVMLPVVDRFGFRRRLQICYKGCVKGLKYERDELDLYWKKGCGAVGWVWIKGQEEVCGDNGEANTEKAWSTLPEAHNEIVKAVKSLISMPILQNGRPIGVLNLDGQETLDRTLFASREVKELVQRCAQGLPSFCFPDGVRPR